MALKLEKMDKSHWVTAERQSIEVAYMSHTHLRNTILFLKRNAFRLKMQQRTHAAVLRAMAMSDDTFLLRCVPPYKAMLKEATRRKLFVTFCEC